jgi:hypothetical protein
MFGRDVCLVAWYKSLTLALVSDCGLVEECMWGNA